MNEDENFEFYCPNNHLNIENVISIYEQYFSDIPFDGIFIDKIRYGSFANGYHGVFNCFCNECLKKYKNIDELKYQILNHSNIIEDISSYHHGIYQFKHSIWNTFFSLKAQAISNALKEFYEYFHKKNLEVGIDTFSPFMSYFVGQDLTQLEHYCDFIKPMMYRLTQAPAGLPFEIHKFIEECSDHYDASLKHLLKILDISSDVSKEFPISFVKRELNFLTKHLDTPIYIGMEINQILNIANVTPKYIEDNLKGYENTDVQGYVLSWNLLSAPKENIDQVIHYFNNKDTDKTKKTIS